MYRNVFSWLCHSSTDNFRGDTKALDWSNLFIKKTQLDISLLPRVWSTCVCLVKTNLFNALRKDSCVDQSRSILNKGISDIALYTFLCTPYTVLGSRYATADAKRQRSGTQFPPLSRTIELSSPATLARQSDAKSGSETRLIGEASVLAPQLLSASWALLALVTHRRRNRWRAKKGKWHEKTKRHR